MPQLCVKSNSDTKFDGNSKSVASGNVQPNVGVQAEVKLLKTTCQIVSSYNSDGLCMLDPEKCPSGE